MDITILEVSGSLSEAPGSLSEAPGAKTIGNGAVVSHTLARSRSEQFDRLVFKPDRCRRSSSASGAECLVCYFWLCRVSTPPPVDDFRILTPIGVENKTIEFIVLAREIQTLSSNLLVLRAGKQPTPTRLTSFAPSHFG